MEATVGEDSASREHRPTAEQLAEALYASRDLICSIDLDRRFTSWNAGCESLYGWTAEQMLGQPVERYVPESQREQLELVLSGLLRGEDVPAVETTRLTRRGREVTVSLRYSAVRDETGAVIGALAVGRDISLEVLHRSELELSRSHLHARLDHTAVAHATLTPDGRYSYANDAYCELVGWSREALLGRPVLHESCPGLDPGVLTVLEELRLGRREAVAERRTIERRDGVDAQVVAHASPIRTPDGAVSGIALTLQDITALGQLSMHDHLTGLPNRALLLDRAAYAVERSRQAGRPCALLLLGLDDFTNVNAELGHEAGDEVLSAVAQLVGAVLDPLDTLARVQGDTFALLVEGVSEPQELRERARDLQALLAVGVGRSGQQLDLSTSVGAVLGWDGDATELLSAAESALRVAKSQGRACIEVFSESDRAAALDRRAAVADLRRGLAHEEFVLHYQPVVDLRTDVPIGVEALVRWQHPQRGLLPPAAFLDLAEETGLVLDLGAVVLRDACRSAARWSTVEGRPLSVAVNLSLRQIAQPGVAELVRDAVTGADLDPGRLMLEVTETAVTRDVGATTDTLQALREFGVDVAMDDFGTGYSSLTYLRRFPVTAVKIDRSFVSGLGVDGDDEAIVDSVVTLAHAVGIDCIAEGVETREQLGHLLALRCTQGQGYLWSPPLPELELLGWLAGHRPTPAGDPARTTPPRASRRTSDDLDPELVARIRALLDDGASLHTIAAALNAEGAVSPSGARWHARSIARVIAHAEPGRA